MQTFDVGCDFGNVSLGKETVRVGVKVNRTGSLDEWSDKLCGKRLTGRLQVGGKGDAPEQATLPGMDAGHFVAGVFDVRRFGVSAKEITFGATFSASSVDPRELARLANGSGRLIITGIEAIPDEDDDDEDGPGYDDHEDVGPRAKPLESQKTLPVATLPIPKSLEDLMRDHGADQPLVNLKKFGATDGIVKAVRAGVGSNTIGGLEAFIRGNPEFWHRDIKGLGEAKITILQDAHTKFRLQFPMVDAEDRKDIEHAFTEGGDAANATLPCRHEYVDGSLKAKAFELGHKLASKESVADTMTLDDDEPADEVEVE